MYTNADLHNAESNKKQNLIKSNFGKTKSKKVNSTTLKRKLNREVII